MIFPPTIDTPYPQYIPTFSLKPLYKNGLEKENEFSKKEIAKPYVSPSKGSENTLSEIILN